MPHNPTQYMRAAVSSLSAFSTLVAGADITASGPLTPVVWGPDGSVVPGSAFDSNFAGYALASATSGGLVPVGGMWGKPILVASSHSASLAAGPVKISGSGVVPCDNIDTSWVGTALVPTSGAGGTTFVVRPDQGQMGPVPLATAQMGTTLAPTSDCAAGVDIYASNSLLAGTRPASVDTAPAASRWLVFVNVGDPVAGWAVAGSPGILTSTGSPDTGNDSFPTAIIPGGYTGTLTVGCRYRNVTSGSIAAATISNAQLTFIRVR